MSTASFSEIRVRIPVWPWGRWWSAETVKELRALGPAWLFTLLVPGAIASFEDRAPALESFSMAAFVFGCAVMGALAFGHEFNHRTLGLHLSQPVTRRHLWWSKMRVLGWALASVSVALVVSRVVSSGVSGQEWIPIWREPFPVIVFVLTVATLCVGSRAGWWPLRVCIWGGAAMVMGVGAILLTPRFGDLAQSDFSQVAAMGGVAFGVAFFFFCAAPLYTLVTRSTLAGAVFSLVITMAILVLASAGTTAWVRSHPDFFAEGWGTMAQSEATERFLMICWSLGMGLFCIFALVVGRRKFIRMEAIDSRGRELALPQWLTAPLSGVDFSLPGAPSGNLVRLIRKELGLHHVSLLLASLLVVLWGGGMVARLVGLDLAKEPGALWPPIFGYMVLVPLLCGAVACAEERTMGTLEWHLTMPASTGRQWLIKCIVALGLSFVLVGILPLGLVFGWGLWGDADLWSGVTLQGIVRLWGVLLVLTSLGLYASSFARNTVKAALWGVGFWCLLGGAVGFSFRVIRALAPGDLFDGGGRAFSSLGAETPNLFALWLPWVWGCLAVCGVFGFVALLLRLGLANYRLVDISPRRLAAHLGIASAAILGLGFLVLGLLAVSARAF